MNNLAQEIHQKYPFELIVNEESLNYSSALMNEIIKPQSLILELYNAAKENNIPVSQKKLEVENSIENLRLLKIDDNRCFLVTPFARQGNTRSITFILENTIDIINEKKQIVGSLLPNLSGSVSVIPFDDNLYKLLNDANSVESKAILNLSFKVGGHCNSFVLFLNDSNFSDVFKKSITEENSTKINCVKYYLENKHDFSNEISSINDMDKSPTRETQEDIMPPSKLVV